MDIDVARVLLQDETLTISAVAGQLGVTASILYRYLPAARSAHNEPFAMPLPVA